MTKAIFPEYEGLHMTMKQQLFVKAYVRPDIAFNGSRAYVEAYGLDAVDDLLTARAAASRLLTNVNVQKAVSIELDRQLNDHEQLGRRVMAEWQKLAFFDVTQFLNVQGPFVYLSSIEELPVHFRPAIKSIENTQMGVKVTFHDKQKALESIAKCLGMFTETVRTVDEKYETLVQRLARQEAEGRNDKRD
jgi:phage terminase small subunit